MGFVGETWCWEVTFGELASHQGVKEGGGGGGSSKTKPTPSLISSSGSATVNPTQIRKF